MNTRCKLFATCVALLALSAAPSARAEVSAETDAFGTYLRTVIFSTASAKNVKIWSVQRNRGNGLHPLNPDGDLFGDLWPVIRENPKDSNHPWIVWSRSNGSGYDLGWSRWTTTGWSPLDWVEDRATAGDDLDPSMALDGDGRPHIAWCRGEAWGGKVYLSLFLVTRWMAPFPVSDDGVDSRNPAVDFLPDGRIRVSYDTPQGHVIRIIVFARPDTITDDITPLGPLYIQESTTTPSTDLGR